MTPKHYNPATQRYWYRCIPAETVPENKRTLATRALRFFAADLALSPALPKIIWVIPEDWQIAHEAVSAANRRAFETGEPYQCDCFNEAEDFGGYTSLTKPNRFTFVQTWILDEFRVLLRMNSVIFGKTASLGEETRPKPMPRNTSWQRLPSS